MFVLNAYTVTEAVGTVLGLGGGFCAQFLCQTYIYKEYTFVHLYICNFQNPLSYEPI